MLRLRATYGLLQHAEFVVSARTGRGHRLCVSWGTDDVTWWVRRWMSYVFSLVSMTNSTPMFAYSWGILLRCLHIRGEYACVCISVTNTTDYWQFLYNIFAIFCSCCCVVVVAVLFCCLSRWYLICENEIACRFRFNFFKYVYSAADSAFESSSFIHPLRLSQLKQFCQSSEV